MKRQALDKICTQILYRIAGQAGEVTMSCMPGAKQLRAGAMLTLLLLPLATFARTVSNVEVNRLVQKFETRDSHYGSEIKKTFEVLNANAKTIDDTLLLLSAPFSPDETDMSYRTWIEQTQRIFERLSVDSRKLEVHSLERLRRIQRRSSDAERVDVINAVRENDNALILEARANLKSAFESIPLGTAESMRKSVQDMLEKILMPLPKSDDTLVRRELASIASRYIVQFEDRNPRCPPDMIAGFISQRIQMRGELEWMRADFGKTNDRVYEIDEPTAAVIDRLLGEPLSLANEDQVRRDQTWIQERYCLKHSLVAISMRSPFSLPLLQRPPRFAPM